MAIRLTNDQWNEAPTLEASGALVYAEPGTGRTLIPGLTLHAGPLLRVLKDELTDPLVELSPDQLKAVEDAISEFLGLNGLLSDPPRAPLSHLGPSTTRAGRTSTTRAKVWELPPSGSPVHHATRDARSSACELG